MSGEYRIFAGILVMMVVIFSILTLAGSSSPNDAVSYADLTPNAGTNPITRSWNSFSQFNIPVYDASGCPNVSIALQLCQIAVGFVWIVQFMIQMLITIGSFVINIMILFVGLIGFDVPAISNAPWPVPIIRYLVIIPLGFVIVLFIVRLFRSLIPWVSGEGA